MICQESVIGTNGKPAKVLWRAVIPVKNRIVPFETSMVGEIAMSEDFEISKPLRPKSPLSKSKHVFVGDLPLSGFSADKHVAGHSDV